MRLPRAIALTLLALASSGASTLRAQTDHLEALIDTRQAAGRAIAAGDIDGLLSHWTEDVVIYPVDEPAVRGKEAVGAWVRGNRARGIRPRVQPIDVVASDAGDIAYVIGTHDWVNAEGDASRPGRYVTLWRRTEAGEWKMFLEIHSPSPASQAEDDVSAETSPRQR